MDTKRTTGKLLDIEPVSGKFTVAMLDEVRKEMILKYDKSGRCYDITLTDKDFYCIEGLQVGMVVDAAIVPTHSQWILQTLYFPRENLPEPPKVNLVNFCIGLLKSKCFHNLKKSLGLPTINMKLSGKINKVYLIMHLAEQLERLAEALRSRVSVLIQEEID